MEGHTLGIPEAKGACVCLALQGAEDNRSGYPVEEDEESRLLGVHCDPNAHYSRAEYDQSEEVHNSAGDGSIYKG